MITRWTAIYNRLRRGLSPTEWFVRWLRLPSSQTTVHERGLILIQIDGLSRTQLEDAIADGRMPFLKRLLKREQYQLHDLYSGLPSSTPSVQGELFYGVRCVVPAFGFRDHRNGRVVRMFSQDITHEVEQRLELLGSGVLKGGSAYCNIYGGGAQETHFCASSLGWDEVLQAVNPLKLATLVCSHLWSVLRTVGLVLTEICLACLRFLRRTLKSRELWQELMMIPARVVVVILMRELATISARMDAARGLPIIHLNMMGYDEQAHRDGPASAFAHWTLKGIDGAVYRLWNTAHRSARRQYDVWVYSDHGQETTTPYQYVTGQQIQQAVIESVEAVCGRDGGAPAGAYPADQPPSLRGGESVRRARWLSAGWIVGKLFGEELGANRNGTVGVQVAALGPLGLVYVPQLLTFEQRVKIAEQLVYEKSVPLACITTAPGAALVITPQGHFQLPRQGGNVFGDEHPFLDEIADDLVQLCHHPDAGDLVLSGWSCDGTALSFVLQHGAHAGPGPQETGAFALLPFDAPLVSRGKAYLRPDQLRESIFRFAVHATPETAARIVHDNTAQQPVRVMTYNVHACIGMDGQLSSARIARVIAQSDADIVALQELDVFRDRTGFRDQAHDIARHLEMECHFHPAWQLEEEKYGDAILSRFPLRLVQAGELPAAHDRREPRGAIWVELDLADGATIHVLNTHLSIYPGERFLQSQALVVDWIRRARKLGPTVLCGDFNARPPTPAYQLISQCLQDVQTFDGQFAPKSTWFSPRPLARIDHVFITPDWQIIGVDVVHSRLAQVASDHLPLVADVRISVEAPHGPPSVGHSKGMSCG